MESLSWSQAIKKLLLSHEDIKSLAYNDTVMLYLEKFELFCLTNEFISQLAELTQIKKRKVIAFILTALLTILLKIVKNNPSFIISLFGFYQASMLTQNESTADNINLLTYWIMYSALELILYSSSLISIRNIIKLIMLTLFRDPTKRQLMKRLFMDSYIQ